MPRASELFYTRRSRISQNSDDAGSDSSSSRLLDRCNRLQRRPHSSNAGRGRLDPNVCDTLRRQPPQLRSSHQPRERELIRPELDATQFSSGNATHVENQNNARDGVRFNGNGRLPGAVVLARERLLHRLSATTLSSDRCEEMAMNAVEDSKKKSEPKLVKLDTSFKLAEQWVNNMSASSVNDKSAAVELEGRPARLGIGATVPRESQVTLSNDPVERKLFAKLNAYKRKVIERDGSEPSARNRHEDEESEEDESESRTKVFGKKRPMSLTPTVVGSMRIHS